MDLQAGGKLPGHIDPVAVALELPQRYESLWKLLNRRIT